MLTAALELQYAKMMSTPLYSGPAKAEALLVSDRGPLVRSLRESLERSGYDVIWAHTGALGAARARDDSPDLVVVDTALQDIPALEFCSILRNDPAFTSSTPVVI